MKDIIKDIIVDTHFYEEMQKSDDGVFMTFENLELSKTDLIELKKNHLFNNEDDILMIFTKKNFQEGDFWYAGRVYEYSILFLADRISFYKVRKKNGIEKERDWWHTIKYEYIDDVEICQNHIRFYYNEEGTDNSKEDMQEILRKDTARAFQNFLMFQETGNGKYFNVEVDYWGLDFFRDSEPLNSFFKKIKESINQLEVDYEQSKEDYREAINEAFDADDYQKAYSILEAYNFLKDYFFYTYDLAYIYYMLDDHKNSLLTIDGLLESSKEQENSYWTNRAKMFKSLLIEEEGSYYDALLLFNEGLNNYEDKGSNGFYSEERSDYLYETYLEVFKELPYKERKVIYITNSNEKFKSDSLTVLQANQLPNITFPAHHPINNETYIGHPYNNNLYIPIQNYDNELLIDRINEFCYLLQCLGAEEIMIENVNNNDNSNLSKQQTDVNVGVAGLKMGVEVDNKNTQGKSSENKISLRIGKNQIFNPLKYPYVPSELTWLENETGWQRLIKQRLEGSLLEHNEFMTSNQSQVLNTNEINDLKIDLKLFFTKANVNVRKDFDAEIKNSSSSEWKVHVKFKPIDQFNPEDIITTDFIDFKEFPAFNNDKEQEFLEEYQFLTIDGELSERDTRTLNRMRERLSISKERADYLIESLTAYSDEEKELVEEIKFMMEDGEITEKEERILFRLANRLGISRDRCLELIKIKYK